MAGRYDEDVNKNPYFSKIIFEHPPFLEKIVASKGILCVPKYSITRNWSPSQTDIEDHILLPTKDVVNDDDDFITVSDKVVHIADGKLVTKSGFATSKQVTVLFAETFYTDSGGSYRVFCIDGLLNTSVDISGAENQAKNIPQASFRECLELLWSHPGGHKTRDSLDKVLNTFAMTYDRLEGETLRSIVDVANTHFTKAMQLLLKDPVVDVANTHFTKAMQLLLKDPVVRRTIQQNPCYMDSVKLGVETYVMNSVHKDLLPVITATLACQDAEINKINRNLVDLRPSDLGIRTIFRQNIPPAKKELNSINLYNTPMEKLLCLKRVVAALTRPPKSLSKEHSKDSVAMMSTDDLLPIMIFLIVKSEVPNWMTNLVYMQHFHFSKSSDDDEFGFYLASVEAAIEHIKSGNITDEIKPLKRDRWNTLFVTDSSEKSSSSAARSLSRQISHSALDDFFKLVQEGDVKKVQQMLEQPHKISEEVHQKLCHPLCACGDCDRLMSRFRSNSDLVTPYSRDSRGYTALHFAAWYKQELLIDLLIQKNAIVDTTDYLGLTPLHLACQRGFQNVICVKTLLFHKTNLKKLKVNVANESGDTALHLAAKWGYESIVKILLENGGDATLCNKRKQTPVSLAQNVRVQRCLQSVAEDPNFHTSRLLQPASTNNESESRVISACSSSAQNFTCSSRHEEKLNPYDQEISSRVQTTSLEAATEGGTKSKDEMLLQAIIDGDTKQVKFYLGIPSDTDGEDDNIQTPPSSLSLGDMCHPLCQCDKCLLIQKTFRMTGNGVNVNAKSSGFFPIHVAVLHDRSDIVSLLISCNVDINVQDHKSFTPLHLACCVRSTMITGLLVKAGARLNLRDTNGNTPLLAAVCHGFVNGVQTLIKAGASKNSTNGQGNTVLHEALKRDDGEISTLLLNAGADPRIRNKHGKLPLDETDVGC